MYRRSTIPNEAHLTAFEILRLTTEQYVKKRKPAPAAALAKVNGNGKIKSAKPSPRHNGVHKPASTQRAAKKS